MSLITFQKPIRVQYPPFGRPVRVIAAEGTQDKKFLPGPGDLSARFWVTSWLVHPDDSPDGRGTVAIFTVAEETRLEIDIKDVLSVVG